MMLCKVESELLELLVASLNLQIDIPAFWFWWQLLSA